MNACIHIYRINYLCIDIDTYEHVCKRLHIYIYIYIYICTYVDMCICICKFICIYVCMYIHKHIYFLYMSICI
jgi:hypothetical protein